MPITIAGSGTITGISAGGLPDASIVTADIADANITAAKLSGAQSGSAPIYGARAFVNFNGTGVVAIRASGNVSSITDNGTGDYTVNLTSGVADENGAAVGITWRHSTIADFSRQSQIFQATSSTIRVVTWDSGSSKEDHAFINVALFR